MMRTNMKSLRLALAALCILSTHPAAAERVTQWPK